MKRLSWLALLLLAVPVAAKPRPRLELRGPALVLPNDYSGLDPRAIVTFVAQINGPINEEWYCPKVEWTWPDTTRSVEESDCEPFSAAEAAHAPYRWTKTVNLPEGQWTIVVRFYKNDKLLGEATARVRVGGLPETERREF